MDTHSQFGVKTSRANNIVLALLLVLFVFTQPSTGCPDDAVFQSGSITVTRGASLKLNCTFNATLQEKKPSLTWTKRVRNKGEVAVYPAQSTLDVGRFHVDPEVFKSQADAGLLIENLRWRDSGLYLCQITILEDGHKKQCRTDGTYVNVQGTLYDSLIACCPLGVFIAALLVLHGMVYKKWWEYKELGRAMAKKKRLRIQIPAQLRCV